MKLSNFVISINNSKKEVKLTVDVDDGSKQSVEINYDVWKHYLNKERVTWSDLVSAYYSSYSEYLEKGWSSSYENRFYIALKEKEEAEQKIENKEVKEQNGDKLKIKDFFLNDDNVGNPSLTFAFENGSRVNFPISKGAYQAFLSYGEVTWSDVASAYFNSYKDSEGFIARDGFERSFYNALREKADEEERNEMIKSEKKDNVNHPSHYTQGGIEVLDFIKAWNMDFIQGNVIKYVTRHKFKGKPVEDLKKAEFYLKQLIKIAEKENKND